MGRGVHQRVDYVPELQHRSRPALGRRAGVRRIAEAIAGPA
jgi:hypothetical protein